MAGEIIYNQSPEKFWEFKEDLFKSQGTEKTIWATEKFLLDFVKDKIHLTDCDQFKSDLKAVQAPGRTYPRTGP